MAYTTVKFLGASVRGCNSTIGWNEQKSTLSVQLVVDALDGDSLTCLNQDGTINDAVMGLPTYFQLGSFRFNGLLQKVEKRNDTGGLPTYDVVVEDPRDILANCEVILGGYSGSVGGVRNLISPFGYWENRVGFGRSLVNGSGMPWSQLRPALLSLINTPQVGLYGGPLHYRGINYGIDISQLPTTPGYYRVGGGNSLSLMEIISQICADGGCDYFVELVGTTIRIRTVSRRRQPALGTISRITSTNWGGTVVRSNAGLEVRNEITSAFVIGGPVSTLHLTSGIASFWGYDVNGNPILGVPGRFDFLNRNFDAQIKETVAENQTFISVSALTEPFRKWPATPFLLRVGSEIMRVTRFQFTGENLATLTVTRGMYGSTRQQYRKGTIAQLCLASADTEYMNLNASEVADIIGSTFYSTSTIEMRFALIDFASWSGFMAQHRPDFARLLGLIGPIQNLAQPGQVPMAQDKVNDAPDRAKAAAKAVKNLNNDYIKQHQFYEFVRRHAQDYMGKKYAVSVPFVLHQQDPETLRVNTSYSVADGGYLPEGSSPLGLSLWNEDVFKNADGTFRAFVRYDNIVGANLTSIPSESALEPPGIPSLASKLFLPCTVDPHLIYTPAPAVVITLGEGLFDRAIDIAGDGNMVAAAMQQNGNQAAQGQAHRAHGVATIQIFPAHRTPAAAAIPLRSNTQTYGPWYASLAHGKVRFEQDQTLVPWEYGGFEYMNQVGTAKVIQAVTAMQVAEAGTIEFASPPQWSLGDAMQSGGPNITNIGVSYGTNGVTTSYSFSTWTPRFGVFNRQAAERMRKMGQTAQELRRAIRTAMVAEQDRRETIGRAVAGRRALLRGIPKGLKPQTPHEVLIANALYDDVTEKVRTGVSSSTYEEAIPGIGPDDDDLFKRSAAMSLSGLLRPFTTERSASLLMPAFADAEIDPSGLNVHLLNPWRGQNDIEIYTWGSTYEGLHAFRREPDLTGGVRAMGLRLPAIGVGWGYDWEGRPVPYYGDTLYTETGATIPASSLAEVDGGFPTGYLTRPDWWAAGPLDVLYDRRRGVWTVHDVVKGYEQGSILAGGTGVFSVYRGDAEDYDLNVERWDGELAFFVAHDRKWYLMPTSDGGGTIPTGEPYTLYWQGPTGSPTWEGSPTITSLSLGGDAVGADGYLELGTSLSAFTTRLATQDRFSDVTLNFPANEPGSGDLLVVSAMVGDEVDLSWAPLTNYVETGVYVFETPEFITTSTATGKTISANWGDDIQPIGWLDYEGSGELFARHDHEHSHPVFSSGDLHPEYNLPTGTIYSVLWSEMGGSERSWSQTPNTRAIVLGNSTLGAGYADYYGDTAFRTRLKGGDIDQDVELLLPDTVPVVGYSLKVASFAGGIAQLTWGDDLTGSGTLPASQPYSVLWSSADSVVSWSSIPEVQALVVGTGTTDGYVSFAPGGSLYFLSLYPGGSMADNLDILFPSTTGDVGQLLGVAGRTGNRVTLDWFEPFPSPDASYQMAHTNDMGELFWSDAPRTRGILLGDDSVNPGYIGLQVYDGFTANWTYIQPQARANNITLKLPAGDPVAKDLLGVSSFGSNEATMTWYPWSAVETVTSAPAASENAGYMVYDTTNHILYISEGGGTWRSIATSP